VKLLVTGASGFLGRAVCAELLERGHGAAALVRRPGSEPAGVRAVRGDLTDGDSLAAALAGERPDCVIHMAAEIASQRDVRRIHEVNVAGTRRLLEACTGDGSPRFVFTSTSVTGDPHGAIIDEGTELAVETAYGRSKQEGERLVRESGLETAIVRPGHIYGPGGWYVDEFVKRLKQPGRFAVIGRGDNWWDVVRVEDVASAVVDCAEQARPGALYHVVDDEPITFYDFMALTAEALGVGAPRRLPAALARIAAGRDPVLSITRSARNSNARIKRELGWEPRFPTARVGVPDAIAALA
jgi:nucleoside-diphosphate-sugar epimerase